MQTSLAPFTLNHVYRPAMDFTLERNGIVAGEKRKVRITGIMSSGSLLAVDVDIQFKLNGRVVLRIAKVMSGGQRLNVLSDTVPVPGGNIVVTAELLRAHGIFFGHPLYPASVQFRNLVLRIE